MPDMIEHARFTAAVARSWGAVWAVAHYIHSRGGCDVTVRAHAVRPDPNQACEGFGDADGDVIVIVRRIDGDNRRAAVEVKGREIDFTNAADFPFPTIIVDRAEKADRGAVYAYFTVNRAKTHAAIVYSHTRPSWIGPHPITDNSKGYDVTVYECPVADARFVSLGPL